MSTLSFTGHTSTRVARSSPRRKPFSARPHATLQGRCSLHLASANNSRVVGTAPSPGGPTHCRRRLPPSRGLAAMAAASTPGALKSALLVIDMQASQGFLVYAQLLPLWERTNQQCGCSCPPEHCRAQPVRLARSHPHTRPGYRRTTFACQAPCCAWRAPWAACPRWLKLWMWCGPRACPSSGSSGSTTPTVGGWVRGWVDGWMGGCGGGRVGSTLAVLKQSRR